MGKRFEKSHRSRNQKNGNVAKLHKPDLYKSQSKMRIVEMTEYKYPPITDKWLPKQNPVIRVNPTFDSHVSSKEFLKYLQKTCNARDFSESTAPISQRPITPPPEPDFIKEDELPKIDPPEVEKEYGGLAQNKKFIPDWVNREKIGSRILLVSILILGIILVIWTNYYE